MHLLRQPLLRLLAINLAIGAIVAVLMLAGLLALNPHRLRDLILADSAGAAAAALLLFGFVITFGSTAMGSAITMLSGKPETGNEGGNPVAVPVRVSSRD